ncbi:SMI1/KNR4 family protein [Nocardia brasiliensis]|uniref:SMI1/KNR4 family protein n=1 Tax=Nocardia brasiliensis TaxID=37326 RepID=UPI0004A6A8D0|nr:SMI1/KNR4 family protein [Nocardia brasiliensis]
MTELAEMVERLAREFAESGATGGTLRMHHSQWSNGIDPSYVVGTDRVHQVTGRRELAHAVRAELGVDMDGVVEMRLRLSGDSYEFQYLCTPGSSERFWDAARRLVLDPDYRYPGHRQPITAADTVPDDRSTDPAVLATVRELVSEYIEAYTAAHQRGPELAAGAAEADIAAAEARIGRRLPEDLRALYRLVGHDHDDRGVLGITRLSPLSDVAASHLSDSPTVMGLSADSRSVGDDSLFTGDRVVSEGWPHGTIQRVSRSAGWIFLGTSDRNAHAVDLDPGPAGRRGQLIDIGLGYDSATRWAVSVTEALQKSIESQRAGENFGSLYDTAQPAHTRRLDDPAETIDDLPDKFAVQKLDLRSRDSFDAAELAALPMLRQLRLEGIRTLNLAVPQDIPLESLRVSGPHFDLEPLSGHPVLWDVHLAGAQHPVRLAPLAALKNLQRLDISEIDAADPEIVAELANLRVLVANLQQWRRLRELDAVPAHLAAAELAGDASFADEAAWADTFGRGAEFAELPVIRGALGEVRVRPQPESEDSAAQIADVMADVPWNLLLQLRREPESGA